MMNRCKQDPLGGFFFDAMNIGSVHIDKPLALAPMENVTDHVFRTICKKSGADLLFTEFVNAEGLIRDSKKTHEKMFFSEEERPFGIQVYGSLETSMEQAARIAEQLNPDFIDINCGCWVRKIAMRGAGAGLLKDLSLMEKIISSVVKAVTLPVTVKTRLGWDADSIQIVEVAKMIEQTGAKVLTLHCRTRGQGHDGDPDFKWIPQIKRAVSIPVIANGGLDTPEKIKKVYDETECDGVMIGRGAIDNPWIFKQTREYMEKGSYTDVTFSERIELLVLHLEKAVVYKGERKGVLESRKLYSGYLKGMRYAAKLRAELMKFEELLPVKTRLLEFRETVSQEDPAVTSLQT